MAIAVIGDEVRNLLERQLRGRGNAETILASLEPVASSTPGTLIPGGALVTDSNGKINLLCVDVLSQGGSGTAAGGLSQGIHGMGRKTGIADNTATSILRVTCPNAAHLAMLDILFLATPNNSGVGDSARCASGLIVFSRVTGANLAATATALTKAGIVTPSGGTTITFAYGVSAVAGGVTAVNTIDIQVTIVKTGNASDHQVLFRTSIYNSEAGGMTLTVL